MYNRPIQLKLDAAFALGIMAVSLGWAGDLWWTERCLATSGARAQALITQKRVVHGKHTSYRLEFTFTDSGGMSIESSQTVQLAKFNQVAVGTRTPVYYCTTASAYRHTLDPRTHRHNMIVALLITLSMAAALGVGYALTRLAPRLRKHDAPLPDRDWADPLANRRPRVVR